MFSSIVFKNNHIYSTKFNSFNKYKYKQICLKEALHCICIVVHFLVVTYPRFLHQHVKCGFHHVRLRTRVAHSFVGQHVFFPLLQQILIPIYPSPLYGGSSLKRVGLNYKQEWHYRSFIQNQRAKHGTRYIRGI